MSTSPLSPDLTGDVLRYLGVEAGAPSIVHLDTLLTAYTRTVPWESAFRIAKRARTNDTADCPRWPNEFWRDAIDKGGGGTCFESNYAFFSLLRALGYEGYLTVNNMLPKIGCHTAIRLNIADRSWLADVGLPIYAALPIEANGITQRASPFHTYTVRPDGEHEYQIERDQHQKTNCFTLVDRAVAENDYRQATTDDYGANGLFLNRVIVNKIIDGRQWRFTSDERPLHFEVFEDGRRIDHIITGDVAEAVAQRFGMDAETLRAALDAVGVG
jgi:arylamine N-acetyltransferase